MSFEDEHDEEVAEQLAAERAEREARRAAAEKRVAELGPQGMSALGTVEAFRLSMDLGLGGNVMGGEPAWGPPRVGEVRASHRHATVMSLLTPPPPSPAPGGTKNK